MSRRTQSTITAPSYGELFRLVHELRNKIKVLEAASVGGSSTGPVAGSSLGPVAGSSTGPVAGSFTSPVVTSSTGPAAVSFTSPLVRSSKGPVAVCEGSISDQWSAMNCRLQGVDETLSNYYYDKARLCQALRLPFSEVREYIIQGIRSPALFMYAMCRTHENMSDLLADLTYWERMSELRQNRFGLASELTEVDRGLRRPSEKTLTTSSMVDIKPDLTVVPKLEILPSITRPPVTYYNSHDPGYISEGFPNLQQPTNEHPVGQWLVRCTQQQPQCSDQALPSNVHSSTEKANPFVKPVQLNGKTEVDLNKSFNSETESNIPVGINPQTKFKEITTNNYSCKRRVSRAPNYLRDYL